MSDAFVQINPDSSGKKVDTSELLVNGNTVERQRVNISDPTTPAGLAVVINSTPSGSEYGLVVRQSGTTQTQGNVASGSADSGNPTKIGGVYNTSPPTFTDGQRGDLQIDSSGNLLINQRYLKSTDVVTVQQLTANQLNTIAWLYDGLGGPLSSWSPTGGTNILKVAPKDTRLLFSQGTGTVTSSSGNSGDFNTAQLCELAIDINIASVVSSGTLAFFLDRKGNEATPIYYQVATLGTAQGVGAKSYDVGPGLTTNISVGNIMRLRWTLSGTSTTGSMNIWGKT